MREEVKAEESKQGEGVLGGHIESINEDSRHDVETNLDEMLLGKEELKKQKEEDSKAEEANQGED